MILPICRVNGHHSPFSYFTPHFADSMEIVKLKPINVSRILIRRDQIILPIKKETPQGDTSRENCFFCQNWYNPRENRRGSCK